jgi:hypothetical protein
MMVCLRCFHIVGEHYLCREHGGEDGFSAGFYKLKQQPRDFPPPEAMNNPCHSWFDFLDKTDLRKLNKDVPMGQMKFREVIP